MKAGHVRLNGQRTKAARELKVGDKLDIAKGRIEFEVAVSALPERRGPASEALQCYCETPQSIERRRIAAEQRTIQRTANAPTAGRPDKRTRRRIRSKQRDAPEPGKKGSEPFS